MRKKGLFKKTVAGTMASVMTLGSPAMAQLTFAASDGSPAAVEIGHPVFKNTELLEGVYDLDALGVSTGEKDIMKKIYEQDLANGGDSFYMDRVLAREGVANGSAGRNGNDDANTFLTRGRALYMYTSTPSVIGFGGNTAYHQPMASGDMYSVTFRQNGSALSARENTAKRVNYPSNWVSQYTVGSDLTADVTKFISDNNVAVTAITLNNTSGSDQTVTVQAASSFVANRSEVEIGGETVPELVGTKMSPSNLTKITPRLTGDGFTYVEGSNSALQREVTIPAGESVDLKVVMAFTTEEIPESTTDYVRFSELDNLSAIRAQKAEYNLYWAENLPYIDVPNDAVQKAIDYRWWSERFNSLDANIPGYDYQYPITIEGVLGYNNAIVLTQPMHLQDTKWLRGAYLPLGQLLSVGNSSQSSAFLDNPGNRSNWNNHYGQYIGEAGMEAFNVIGGGSELAENLAYYFEHDVKGQLEHYGNHTEHNLIAYRNNYMTGNDADTISMNSASGVGTWKIHGENAYVWAAADAASQLYELTGNTEKAGELKELADSIQEDVLNLLWCEECQKFETYGVNPTRTLHNSNQPNLVEQTESNNWNYFAVGMVPTDETSLAKYKEAFKAFNNGEEFPIFPFYTADQVHNKVISGSNNFSNINFTVQARVYEAALRQYDKEQTYITDEMLALMTEWMAWLIYPDSGDIRYPNNSEFYNIDGRTLDTYYRSWIYHNILGNYNYIFIEDMAGIQPRSDEKLEFDPIDFSYDHFMVNNLRYHGQDISIVWDKPGDGTVHYEGIPEGYSVYVNGEIQFTLADPAHVIYNTADGTLEFPDGAVEVLKAASAIDMPTAVETKIIDEKVLEELAKSGIHGMENLAEGAKVEATYTPSSARAASWASKHRADGSDSTSKAVNEMKPDPQAVTDGMTVNMPFWGNDGSKNDTDALVIDLGKTRTVDMVDLYFYNDRQNGGYTEPAKYTLEYWDGESWQHAKNQSRTPLVPKANYNDVKFTAVQTDKLRVTFTNQAGHYTAVTEIQAYNEGGERDVIENTAPVVKVSVNSQKEGNLQTGLVAECIDDGIPYDGTLTYKWEAVEKPEGATVFFGNSTELETTLAGSVAGRYVVRFTADDGELSTSADLTVELKEMAAADNDVAPAATPSTDYVAGWETIYGINNTEFEPGSSNVGTGKGWGNWGCSGGTGSTHWVAYTWKEPVTINKADIYWYDDNGGTRIPRSITMQYKDAEGNWQDVNIQTPYSECNKRNRYNTIEFDSVTTTELRLNMVLSAAGTGIYRFKVYSVPIQEIDPVYIATKAGVVPALPAFVNARTTEGELVTTNITWDQVDESQFANDGVVTINGINLASGKMTQAVITVRSDMDVATITGVNPMELTTKVGKIPVLPTAADVSYNNGARDNQNVSVTWQEVTQEMVSKVGDVTVEGEVEGTATKASLTIHVVAESVDRTELVAQIAAAEALRAKDYTALSYGVVVGALEAAKQIDANENATQSEVDEAADTLKAAIAGLVELKGALKAEISVVEGISGDKYTEESFAALTEALNQAKAVRDNEDATEEEVNAAVTALKAAEGKLAPVRVNATLALDFTKQDEITKLVDKSENNFAIASDTITEDNFTEGVNGDAILFTGSTSYDIPAGEKLASKDVTLSYWIKRTGTLSGDNPILWAKKDSTYNGNGFYTNYPVGDRYSSFFVMDGFNGFYVAENPNDFLPENEWTHVAVTWNSDTKVGKIYKNGIEQEVRVTGTPASITGESDAANRMGNTGYNNGFAKNMALDEFKVFDSALGADQIAELYHEFDEEAWSYQDVAEDDWFYDEVYFVTEKNLMTGVVPKEIFAPFETLNRAQFATILYRMEGEPAVETDQGFQDVVKGEWYADGVNWAAEKGIVKGYEGGESFGPADMITREQMAVMLYRYAQYKGYDTAISADYDAFKDADKVSPYADDAMKWAVGNGIIKGKEEHTLIDPLGDTIRGECAVMLTRVVREFEAAKNA